MQPLLEPLSQTKTEETKTEAKPALLRHLGTLGTKVKAFVTQSKEPESAPEELPKETHIDVPKKINSVIEKIQEPINQQKQAHKDMKTLADKIGVYRNKVKQFDRHIIKLNETLAQAIRRGLEGNIRDIQAELRSERANRKDFQAILDNFAGQEILEEAKRDVTVARINLDKAFDSRMEPIYNLLVDACVESYLGVLKTALYYRDCMDAAGKEHQFTNSKYRTLKLKKKLDLYFKNHRKDKEFMRGMLENY